MHAFKLKILTPDKKLFDGIVKKVTIPTTDGVITILNGHEPLISNISIGEIIFTDESNNMEKFLVQGGALDVKKENDIFLVVVLADTIVDVNENADLEEEIKNAKKAMLIKSEDIDFAELEGDLERNLFLKRFKGK